MKEKKVYVCEACDYQSPKWMGQCPSCKKWNTFVEETYAPQAVPEVKNQRTSVISDMSDPVEFSKLEMPKYMRTKTGTSELDRVLGGGIVNGSDMGLFFKFWCKNQEGKWNHVKL